jgi:hypothetical protein
VDVVIEPNFKGIFSIRIFFNVTPVAKGKGVKWMTIKKVAKRFSGMCKCKASC